jgi:hypothetical protein
MELGRNRGALNMHVGLTMFPTDYSIPPHDLAVAVEARGYARRWGLFRLRLHGTSHARCGGRSETVVADLMSGQFNDPRVVAFNPLEHCARDVSKDIALEIQSRSDIDGHDVPEALRDFVDSHAGPDRQLALRLA